MSENLNALIKLADEIHDELAAYRHTLNGLMGVDATPEEQDMVEAGESRLRGMFDEASDLMQAVEDELGADDADYREVRSRLMDDFRGLNVSCNRYVESKEKGFERVPEPEPEPEVEEAPEPEPEPEPVDEDLEFLDEDAEDPEVRKKAKAQREKARQEQYARQAKEAEDKARMEAQQKYDAEAERRRSGDAPTIGYEGPKYGTDYDNPRRDEAQGVPQPTEHKGPQIYNYDDILYCPDPGQAAGGPGHGPQSPQQFPGPSMQELAAAQYQREAHFEDMALSASTDRYGRPREDTPAYEPPDPYLKRSAEDILSEARHEVGDVSAQPSARPDYEAAGVFYGNIGTPESMPGHVDYGGHGACSYIPSPPPVGGSGEPGGFTVYTERRQQDAAPTPYAPGASIVEGESGRGGPSAYGHSGGSTIVTPSGMAFVAVDPAVAAATSSALNNPSLPRVHAAYGSTVFEGHGDMVGHEVKTDGYQVSRAVAGVMAMERIISMGPGADPAQLRASVDAARYVAPSLDQASLARVNQAIQAASGGRMQGFDAKGYQPARNPDGMHVNSLVADMAMGTSASRRNKVSETGHVVGRDRGTSAFTTFMEGSKIDALGGAIANSRAASVAKAMEGFAASRAGNAAQQLAGSLKSMVTGALTQGDYRENSAAVLRDGLAKLRTVSGITMGVPALLTTNGHIVRSAANGAARLEKGLYGGKAWSKLEGKEFAAAIKDQEKAVRSLREKLGDGKGPGKKAIAGDLRKAQGELREMKNLRSLRNESAGAVEASQITKKHTHLGHTNLRKVKADAKASVDGFRKMVKGKDFAEMRKAYGKGKLTGAINGNDSRLVKKIEADMERLAATQRGLRVQANAAIRGVPKAELAKFMGNKEAMAVLRSKMASGAALSKVEKAAAAKLRVMENSTMYHNRARFLKSLGKTKSLSETSGKIISNIRKKQARIKRSVTATVAMFGRALARGDDNLHGAATACSIGSNPFVHKGVKLTAKGSLKLVRVMGKASLLATKGGVWLIGGKPAVASLNAHIDVAKETAAAVKQVVKDIPTSAMRAAVNGASFAGKNAARLFEKAAPKTAGAVKDAAKGAKNAVGAVKRGAKKAAKKVGNTAGAKAAKAAANATKAAVSKAAQAVQKLTAAIGKIISFIGAALMWFFIIYFIALAAVLALTSSFGGGTETSDGKMDLSAYDAVITAEWSGYLDYMRNNLADDYDCERIRTFDVDSIAPNKKEILTMLSARCNQRVDEVGRSKWEPYLKYLTRNLNPYEAVVDIEYCSGCYCPSHSDGEGGTYYCSGCRCRGHRVLDVSLRPWVFDITNADTDPELKLSNGSTRTTVASVDDYSGTVVSGFPGWTDEYVLDLAIMVYSQDWTTLYVGIDSISAVEGHGFDLTDIVFDVDPDRPGDSTVPDYARQFLGEDGYRFYTYLGWTYRVPWCATFTSYCFEQIDPGFLPNRGFSSCGQFIQWGINNHIYTPRGSGYKPVAGDIIFFDWEPDGMQDHVGIVCGTDSEYVYTIEGNSGDRVKTKRYSLTSNCIFGYIAVP